MDDYRKYRNQTTSNQGNPWQPRNAQGASGSTGYNGSSSSQSYGQSSPMGSQQYPANADQEEYDYARRQIRSVKQDTLASSRNALRTLQETEQVGAQAINTVGNQTLQLTDTTRQLNLANLHTDVALDKTAELKRLNRHFMIPSFKNPFSKAKQREKELKRQQAHQEALDSKKSISVQRTQDQQRVMNMGCDPSQRFANGDGEAKEAGPSNQTMNQGGYGSPGGYRGQIPALSAEERARYTLKADPNLGEEEEDPELENEIHRNNHEMLGALSNLKKMGINMNSELKIQNERLSEMADRSDKISGKINVSQYRVDKM
ncbi:Protein transport protein S9 plasma membrane t-SNARE [Dispira parvispora]|uniref:Protein transport protein S9 plasma membrane t-SNARE n=1 Tax=Dispira parvispora TaxID=1520584 RepID=A0A9W8ASD1_9FUNG|nr:Protein transport protein S9 plasma membrane t-SNARE [Dispira parvispora]